MAFPYTFTNTTYPAGYLGIDDGAAKNTFSIDDASTYSVRVTGTVNKVGDTVTLTYGADAPGGFANTTQQLTATQYDNSSMIEFVSSAATTVPGETTSQVYRFVLSNTQVFGSGNANRTRFTATPDSSGAYNGGNYTTAAAPCFCTGTLIRCVRDGVEVDVAVEALRVGDLAVTVSGIPRPIRWIGHRTLDCRRHPDPQAAWPVRVAAHAFGEGRPARDLLLSLGHAVCLDMLGEVLVPAFALLNGATVRQEEVDSVTYWHVELESHDVILAEGMPCESYIELGNRGFFQGSDVVALDGAPDASYGTVGMPGTVGAPANYCRPLHLSGLLVEAARLQLVRRAEAAGWQLVAGDPLAGLHILADGHRVNPTVRGLAACFAVPAGARELWLVADAVRPCDCGAGGDGRMLGIRVAGLIAIDGFDGERAIALDDATLMDGWHAAEVEAGLPVRWTSGRAQLPAALLSDAMLLRVELVGAALPRWVAPVAMVGLGAVGAHRKVA